MIKCKCHVSVQIIHFTQDGLLLQLIRKQVVVLPQIAACAISKQVAI